MRSTTKLISIIFPSPISSTAYENHSRRMTQSRGPKNDDQVTAIDMNEESCTWGLNGQFLNSSNKIPHSRMFKSRGPFFVALKVFLGLRSVNFASRLVDPGPRALILAVRMDTNVWRTKMYFELRHRWTEVAFCTNSLRRM